MYLGPPIDDPAILEALPPELASLLQRANGYVAYDGGLHVRGACHEPEWHSLRAAWHGPRAIHRLFPAVRPHDIPFGEDALGHQFVLRAGIVHRLDAEPAISHRLKSISRISMPLYAQIRSGICRCSLSHVSARREDYWSPVSS